MKTPPKSCCHTGSFGRLAMIASGRNMQCSTCSRHWRLTLSGGAFIHPADITAVAASFRSPKMRPLKAAMRVESSDYLYWRDQRYLNEDLQPFLRAVRAN